jgi:hypothetical protein
MKKYTHAWLSLKAVSFLKTLTGEFNPERNKRLEKFLDFITEYPETFVRGAWYPDSIIKDNVEGGHTWKYYLDSTNGRIENRRPPSDNLCLQLVQPDLNQKVSLETKNSALPDRCEALGQMIRDIVLITNKTKSGDVVAYNNSQVALSFLMLAHYICDPYILVHCDNRDFSKPSKIHSDLEDYWESGIKKYFRIATAKERFLLDERGACSHTPASAD